MVKLDSEFAGYLQEIKDKVSDKLEKHYSVVYDWLVGKGESLEERVTNSKFKNDTQRDNYLKAIRDAINEIAKVRKLTSRESNELKRIKDFLEKKSPQQTDLTGAKLNSALQVSGLSDSDIKLDSWKGITNFKTEQAIRDLVAKVKADAGKFGKFQEHLDVHAYDEAKTAKGTDQWTNFIKKGPKVVIGAILYFADYEEADQTAKDTIIAEIKKVNDSAEADKSDLWETDPKKDEKKFQEAVTKYLYRKATGRSLEVKKKKEAPKKKDDTKETGFLKHLKDNWIAYTIGGVVIVVAVIGLVVYFWENIKNWWEPPMENTDEDKSNE